MLPIEGTTGTTAQSQTYVFSEDLVRSTLAVKGLLQTVHTYRGKVVQASTRKSLRLQREYVCAFTVCCGYYSYQSPSKPVCIAVDMSMSVCAVLHVSA